MVEMLSNCLSNFNPELFNPTVHSVEKFTIKSLGLNLGVEMSLTLIGMSYESKKNAHLWRHLGAFFIRLNELSRVSN